MQAHKNATARCIYDNIRANENQQKYPNCLMAIGIFTFYNIIQTVFQARK